MKRTDPALDEIRAVRQEISAQFGHDVGKLLAHYVQLEQQYHADLGNPLLESAKAKPKTTSTT